MVSVYGTIEQTKTRLKRLLVLQKRALRLTSFADPGDHAILFFIELSSFEFLVLPTNKLFNARGGKWYLENCRSRKLFIQSRNLGTVFVMSLEVSFF